MMEETELNLRYKGECHKVKLSYMTHPAVVMVGLNSGKEFSASGKDVFSAFLNLREAMPGYVFQCKGAKMNVHPSRASSQMGGGLMAYELYLGCPARRESIVNIFDSEVVVEEVSPKDQVEFFKRWLRSLGN